MDGDAVCAGGQHPQHHAIFIHRRELPGLPWAALGLGWGWLGAERDWGCLKAAAGLGLGLSWGCCWAGVGVVLKLLLGWAGAVFKLLGLGWAGAVFWLLG